MGEKTISKFVYTYIKYLLRTHRNLITVVDSGEGGKHNSFLTLL